MVDSRERRSRPRGSVRAGWAVCLVAVLVVAGFLVTAGIVAAVGPPYPGPVDGRRVYDTAGALSAETVQRAEQIIRALETRTGAQIAVYTQVKPGVDSDTTESDARALMDQWGVGRKGFDDGLVILFDMQADLWQDRKSVV